MSKQSPRSFTITFSGVVPAIITPIKLAIPNSEALVDTMGLWDTGATGCAITAHLATAMNLKPIARTIVNGVHGPKEVSVYLLDVYLPNNVRFESLPFTECEQLTGDTNCGLLIGMNIIGAGEMVISNFEGHTSLTYRVPATKKYDFAREDNARLAVEAKHSNHNRKQKQR